MLARTILAVAALAAAGTPAPAAAQRVAVTIPLTVEQNPRFSTYKADIDVTIGNLPPLPMGFDTGSTGLHVFSAARLDRRDSGVTCTSTPITFTIGNPARLVYSGVMCSAQLRLGSIATLGSVPIAYLSSVECAPDNPGCHLPNLNDPRAHGGTYGVFGAGITGPSIVPNPILSLPVPYDSRFSIALTRRSGELLVGVAASGNAAVFPLAPGIGGDRWEKGRTCLFVNTQPASVCLAISFDTGNGVPWIHDSQAEAIPQANGLVAAGTRLGFGPPGSSAEATSVVAGTSFSDSIKVVPTTKAPLTNTGIEAFFDRVVTYDNARGTIAVSPRE